MRALRIVLIEDEAATARNLAYILQSIDPAVRIVAMPSSVSAAVAWLKQHGEDFDLIFSDVRLTDGLSFEIFKQVHVSRPVIFVTAYHDYAIEAFKNNGIEYILKPFDDDAVRQALEKYLRLTTSPAQPTDLTRLATVLEQLNASSRSYKRSFLFSYRSKLIPVETVNIAWFYTNNELVYAQTLEDMRYNVDQPLEQLETQIDPTLFFRANRQFIVNRRAIVEIEHYFNGRLLIKTNPATAEQMLVSKARAAAFKNWMDQ